MCQLLTFYVTASALMLARLVCGYGTEYGLLCYLIPELRGVLPCHY
jgi:hypothetical protein